MNTLFQAEILHSVGHFVVSRIMRASNNQLILFIGLLIKSRECPDETHQVLMIPPNPGIEEKGL